MAPSEFTVIAVDPGKAKCGIAVVSTTETVIRAIIPAEETAITCRYLLAEHPRAVIVLGNKTGCAQIRRQLAEVCPDADVQEIAEDMSTLQARERYWQDYPPRGLQRLLPRGMRMPPRPLDDYAAVVLAERFLAGRREAETAG